MAKLPLFSHEGEVRIPDLPPLAPLPPPPHPVQSPAALFPEDASVAP